MQTLDEPRLAVVIIGRNEGARLIDCLKSLTVEGKVVYVDSGSEDGSPQLAKRYVDLVIELDRRTPFTAARARNAGAFAAIEKWPSIEILQFLDGDCILVRGWLDTAARFLARNPKVAVVCGRRRERYPARSIYNQMCDWEWNTPIGPASACGGDAMVRIEPFKSIGGFSTELIAGEEPEMCNRLRARDWIVWRLDAEMTEHDAAIVRFSQWWRRAVRSGFAELDIFLRSLGSDAGLQERRQVFRTVFWGLAIPSVIFFGSLAFSWTLVFVSILYPIQIFRIALSRGPFHRASWAYGLFVTLAKFAGLIGMVRCALLRLGSRPSVLIEYKRP